MRAIQSISFMPKIALYRPAISQPFGIGEVGACAYRGGGGRGGGGVGGGGWGGGGGGGGAVRCGPLSIF